MIATGQGLLGNNMFAYCGNNPVSNYDPAGTMTNPTGLWDKYFSMNDTGSGCCGGGGSLPLVTATGSGLIVFATTAWYATANFFSSLLQKASNLFSPIEQDYTRVEDALGEIASSFGMFQCKEAAAYMAEYLKKNGESAEIITIQYPTYPGNIWSDISGTTISTNGIHVGLLYKGIVYCNVHPYGLPEQIWINDFVGIGEKTVYKVAI